MSTQRTQHEPGDLIFGEYEVLGLAGVGATSFVYRCQSARLGGVVAVKVLHDDLVGVARHRRRFLREAHLMRGLSHRNIVRVLDIIATPTVLAYVMEDVPGPSLLEWFNNREPGVDLTLLAVCLGVLSGLEHAHRRGIVHRDLKPANILLDTRSVPPSPRIIDFGVARLVRLPPEPEDLESIRGTAAYISPDEVRGPLEVCPQSDLYSLGVILYEIGAGVRPFEGRPGKALLVAHLKETPVAPSMHNDTLPVAFDELVMTLLSKDPADRVPSTHALGDALAQALSYGTLQHAGELPGPVEDHTIQWVAAFQLLLLAILAALLNSGHTGREDDPHYLSRPYQELPSIV